MLAQDVSEPQQLMVCHQSQPAPSSHWFGIQWTRHPGARLTSVNLHSTNSEQTFFAEEVWHSARRGHRAPACEGSRAGEHGQAASPAPCDEKVALVQLEW